MPFQIDLPPSAAVLNIYVYEGEDGTNTATTAVEGKNYETSSEATSAVFRLCCCLLAEGLGDTPYRVIQQRSGIVAYMGASWHRLAKITVIVSDTPYPVTAQRYGAVPYMSEGWHRLAKLPVTVSERVAHRPSQPRSVCAITEGSHL